MAGNKTTKDKSLGHGKSLAKRDFITYLFPILCENNLIQQRKRVWEQELNHARDLAQAPAAQTNSKE